MQRKCNCLVLVPFFAFLITGCGGGGSTNAPRAPATPTISVNPASPVQGQSISLSASSTDPQGSSLLFSWNFGDGSTGAGPSVTHTYTTAGKFTVKVTASDQQSLSSSSTTSISVTSAPPNLGAIEISGNGMLLGEAVRLDGFAVDPNNLPVSFAWNFGDTTTGSGALVHHVYGSVGTFTITLTATNSGGGSAQTQTSISVQAPTTPLPPQQDVLSADCTGPFCGATNAATYAGTGVGIWRYNNATSSDATINVVINGVAAGETAILTFSNGQSTAADSTPVPGSLQDFTTSPVTTAAADVHTRMLVQNREVADKLVRNFSARKPLLKSAVTLKSGAPMAASVPIAVGTNRTWNDLGNAVTTSVQASCALPTGRNAVFWVDQLIDQSATLTTNLAALESVYCGSGIGYASLVDLLGDAWGPAASSSPSLIQDVPGALQDINIVIPKKLSLNDSGYFSSANNETLAANPSSNQALVVFINGEQLVLPDEGPTYASVLIHESTHLINFYQRAVARGTSHDVWLEETSAMMSEDIVTPHVLPDFDETFARQQGYLTSGGNVGYVGWTAPSGQSYNLGAVFGAFLDRRYGLNVYKQLITDCVDGTASSTSYQCMDRLITQNGGLGFADEFARVGASIFGGMSGGSLPLGYGYPGIVADGYFLGPLDSSSMRNPTLATDPQALTSGYLATSHTYQIDPISTGNVYQRNGVVVPAGTTMILVIQ